MCLTLYLTFTRLTLINLVSFYFSNFNIFHCYLFCFFLFFFLSFSYFLIIIFFLGIRCSLLGVKVCEIGLEMYRLMKWPWLQLICYAICLPYGHNFRWEEEVWDKSECWFGKGNIFDTRIIKTVHVVPNWKQQLDI